MKIKEQLKQLLTHNLEWVREFTKICLENNYIAFDKIYIDSTEVVFEGKVELIVHQDMAAVPQFNQIILTDMKYLREIEFSYLPKPQTIYNLYRSFTEALEQEDESI